MRQKELDKILEEHTKWIHGEDGGKQANLYRADLSGANLTGANLTRANLTRADLTRADLTRADLTGADLTRADLTGADLDFSSWPLWCGSKHVKVSLKLVEQLLAHVAVLDCDDPEYAKIKKLILPYAKKSHRASELELLEAVND